MKLFENGPLLESYQVKDFLADPWSVPKLSPRDNLGDITSKLMITTLPIALFCALGERLIPMVSEVSEIFRLIGISLTVVTPAFWVIGFPIMRVHAKKRYSQIVAAIEHSAEGQDYLEAKMYFDSLNLLATEEGDGRLYQKELAELRGKVVRLWNIAVENSGLRWKLYEVMSVKSSKPPKLNPALLEAIASANSSFDNKLELHSRSRREVEQLL